MDVVKSVIAANVIGLFMVIAACLGIVGGSMVVCGACTIGLLLAGG